jgi:hypothetical protein
VPGPGGRRGTGQAGDMEDTAGQGGQCGTDWAAWDRSGHAGSGRRRDRWWRSSAVWAAEVATVD